MVYAFYESKLGYLTNQTLLSQPNSVSSQLSLGFVSSDTAWHQSPICYHDPLIRWNFAADARK